MFFKESRIFKTSIFLTCALAAFLNQPAFAESSIESEDSRAFLLPEGADKEAWMLLKEAHDSRQVLPANFKGFNAKVTYRVNGEEFKGSIEFINKRGGSKVEIEGLRKDELAWMKDKLLSMIGHRRGGDFAKGDGRHPITFAKGDKGNRLGRLVELHDSLKSSYRVKDKKVLEVTREVPEVVFTISVIQTMTADPGKYLAKHFLVTYRNLKDGSIKRVDGYRDKYEKIQAVWMPVRRVVVTVKPENKTPELREF